MIKTKLILLFNLVAGILMPFFLIGLVIYLLVSAPWINAILFYLHVPMSFLLVINIVTYKKESCKEAREALLSLTKKDLLQLLFCWPLIMTYMFWSAAIQDFKILFKKV